MGIEEVLELLEIDSLDQFEHFEHLAELIECGEDISYEAFATLLQGVDTEGFSELLDEYFEEILQGIPDDAIELYVLMTTIRQQLVGLSSDSTDMEQRKIFIDELFRFRNWYTFDSAVHCKSRADELISDHTMAEALALYRLEKLGEESYEYDYTDALEYPIEEYAVTFTYREEEEETAEEEAPQGEDEYADAFIDSEHPVIDGDYSDDEEEDPLY